jgi:ATP-dependent DNA helicase RecG
MKPSLIKLQKFFKLESERGYDDRAVLGGLSRMLETWEAEARLDGLPEDLITAVLVRLRDYHRLSPSSRQEALHGLWHRIMQETDSPALEELTKEDKPPAPEQPQPTAEALDEQEAVKTEVTVEAEEPFGEQKEVKTEVTMEAEELSGEQKEVKTEVTIEAGEPPGEQEEVKTEVTMEAEESQSGTPAAEKPAQEDVQAEVSTSEAMRAPVTVLPGVGPRNAQTLKRLGLETLEDMLYYFPRRYDDYSQLKPINRLEYGEQVTVIGSVQNVSNRKVRNGQVHLTEVVISDGTGNLRATWFNQPWITKRLREGVQVVLSGKIDQYLGRLIINNPELEQLDQQNLHTNRIVPVYPLTAKITQRWLRRLMHRVITYWAPRLEDPLPETVLREERLMDLAHSITQVHFPDSWDMLNTARYRLAFEEILYLQLGMLTQKRAWQERSGRVFETPQDWLDAQIAKLPFNLTSAQERALNEVRSDLASGHPMNRLLQGDVGSGKTVIAALAADMVVRQGSQAGLMAPTSILAEQHYASLLNLLVNGNGALSESQIRLMIGATPDDEKQEIREDLASGEVKLVIGTHALIEDPVSFNDLQLVIIDEQHRFGVKQRSALRAKGDNPHLMVMTATPIPRSLALTVYGDLDLLVMDEMPPGRQPVDTYILLPQERERVYTLIRKQVLQGNQAFIIYPLIGDDESSDDENVQDEKRAAVEEHRRLQSEVFPDLRLGLLHGRLGAEEKDEVMAKFRDGEYQVLVSTSVVEVGVDIPKATVMLIEGANRFGLAQLHQFRGRVGRGREKAYCILIPQSDDAAENERLAAMVETNDGFKLAEIDLEQRGPGDFLGTRQSGYVAQLHLASLTDVMLIEKVQHAAKNLLDQDPDMELPENLRLAKSFQYFWGQNGIDTSSDIS